MPQQRSINFTNGFQVECTFLSEELVHEGNWLRFSTIKYLDPDGKERCWEAIGRVTRPQGNDTDGVTAIAIYRRMLHYDVIVLVRQYRPALKAYTIEFPSGLLEPSESCEDAAVRTLRNETGWHGEATHISQTLAVDPGCSSAVLRYATVKINGDALENQHSKPQPSPGEYVDLVMIPLSEIHGQLERLTNEGHMIDSRVAIWSIGFQMGLKVAKDAEIDAASTSQSSLPLDGSCVRTGLGSKQVT